ncbi:MAG: DUF2855 family protein [Polyangiales bacterium]
MAIDDTTVHDFAVRRDDFKQSSFFERPLPDLDPGQALLRVDRYALTANNVSYAAAGDALGYWKFFPAEPGWGRLPCFAFADVVQSTDSGVCVGERYFGYFPMSTHLLVTPERVKGGSFIDGTEHRRSLPAAYNRYTEVGADPFYEERFEDAQMLIKPLFMTSFLIDDFLAENAFFGARAAIVTSASSKTSIALASQLEHRSLNVVGLTSTRNQAFVESLGLYDEVVTYDAIESLNPDQDSVVIDMAGNVEVTRRLHEHSRERLKHHCIVGTTHWENGGHSADLPGAKPEFFFAPTQIKKRSADWGPVGLQTRIGEAWGPFVEGTPSWLTVVRAYGRDGVAATYDEVILGRTVPHEGHVLSLWNAP